MKQQLIKTLALALLATGIIFSCKKKESTPETPDTPTTTGGGTTTGGTTGGLSNLLNNQWSFNGTVKSATSTAVWAKDIYGTPNLTAKTKIGDTTYTVYFRMPTYLMTSGSYSILQNSAVLTANSSILGYAISFSGAPYYKNYVALNGGSSIVTKTNADFTIECNNVVITDVANPSSTINLSAKLVAAIPVIPTTNASVTVPGGITTNQFTAGATTYTFNQKDIAEDVGTCKIEGSQTVNNVSIAHSFKFKFSSFFPPSGTYDLVSSPSLIAPGKVYVQFVNTTGGLQVYTSPQSGTLSVVTDANDVSITTSNLQLNSTAGQTISLTGNITH
jgi:hypothetical protein